MSTTTPTTPLTPAQARRRLREFTPDAPGFNIHNAILLSTAAIGAYKARAEDWNEQIFPHLGFDQITYSEPNRYSVEFVTLESDSAFIVAFKGSKEGPDWLYDAATRFVDKRPGKFHAGFSDSVKVVWKRRDKLAAMIGRAIDRGKKVWITGHSLGGAMAVVAAAQCAKDGMPVKAVHTFGQPAVTNKDFPLQYPGLNRRIVRFVNSRDIVPRIPPYGIVDARRAFRKGAGRRPPRSQRYYAGIGKRLYFNLSGEYCPDAVDREVGEGDDGDWLSRVVGRIKAAVSYHSVDRYHHNAWDNRGRLERVDAGRW